MHEIYTQLRERALALARGLAEPAFYREHRTDVERAAAALRSHDLVHQCRSHLDEESLECAHGLCHCEAVARDAGAIVLAESRASGLDPGAAHDLFLSALLAGLLHDIKRKEQNHAVLGSIEADRILSGMGMVDRNRRYITDAIRNHEAFKEQYGAEDGAGRLVSDALYDADKFRWGPENFTTTLWLMVDANDTPPRSLYGVFQEKMRGIARIKQTFRTGTGKRFGPEIIDQGIAIGESVYGEMTNLLAGSGV